MPKIHIPTRTVLYVEDHPVNALLMAAIFERRTELPLVVAASGQEALRLAAGLHPALLLLDLNLPDCHGSQLLGQLRGLAGCTAAPAVAVTAATDFDIANTGFCELWPKPLNLDLVLTRLDALTHWPRVTRASAAAQPPMAASSRPAHRWHAMGGESVNGPDCSEGVS
ncbi:hypothetical protein DBR42_14305 [Pelomonas sp. HMWF004]|nr:hypothetical protein DBR42_14305 [Pelomonas sp. HMWF004]